jgi:hypothetical protein
MLITEKPGRNGLPPRGPISNVIVDDRRGDLLRVTPNGDEPR